MCKLTNLILGIHYFSYLSVISNDKIKRQIYPLSDICHILSNECNIFLYFCYKHSKLN